MSKNITYLTDVVLISCIVPSDQADTILLAARDAGAHGAVTYHAKGYGVRERLGLLGVAVDAEKQIVNIMVSNEQKDIVLNSIYTAGKMDAPGMGFIYITQLEKAATYIPQSVLERLEKNG